jgi:hypothetical protein
MAAAADPALPATSRVQATPMVLPATLGVQATPMVLGVGVVPHQKVAEHQIVLAVLIRPKSAD